MSLGVVSEAAAAPPFAAAPLAAEAVELWALLWSQSQNALHIEPFTDTLRENLEAFQDDRRMDYVPLLIGSRNAVDKGADMIRPTLRARERRRGSRNVC